MKIIIPAILVIAIIGIFSHNAFATGGTLSDGPSCATLGGSWDNTSFTCTITSPLTVNHGETLIINSGVTLIITTGNLLTNYGTIGNNGIISNFGTLNDVCNANYVGYFPTPNPINNIACLTSSITAPPTDIAGTLVNLNSVTTGGVGPFAYSWTLTVPSGSTATLSSTTMQNPTFTPDIAGNYVLGLTVTDSESTPQIVNAASATITVSSITCTPGTYLSSNICVPAPAGSYVSTSGATSPTLCPAGTYQDQIGQVSCILAPAGSYITTVGASSSASITLCPAGTFSTTVGASSSSTCIQSPAGSYTSTSGAVSAQLCPVGTFSSSPGQSSCTLAPTGSYVSSPGSISAALCPAGTFSSSPGSISCVPSSPGTYVPISGTTLALICPAGTYCPNPGMIVPLTCPAGTTSSAGAISCTTVPAPVAPTITSASVATSGKSYSASVPTRPGMTYSWSITDGSITSSGGTSGVTSGTTNSITFTAGTPGALTLSATETNSLGASATGTASITVYPAPITPVITVTNPVNAGQSYSASVPTRPGMTYSWSITDGSITSPGGTSGITSGTTNSITFTAGTPGALTLSTTEINGAGDTSAPGTVSVSVVSLPVLTGVTISNTSPSIGSPVILSANPLCGTGSCGTSETFSYQWSLSSRPAGSQAILSNPTLAQPSFVPDKSGQYDIQLLLRDELGNKATSTDSITVIFTTSIGHVIGHGNIGKGTHFDINVISRDGKHFKGEIGYQDKTHHIDLDSKTITSLVISTDYIEIDGTAKLDDKKTVAFQIKATDPDPDKTDSFSVNIGPVTYTNSVSVEIGEIDNDDKINDWTVSTNTHPSKDDCQGSVCSGEPSNELNDVNN